MIREDPAGGAVWNAHRRKIRNFLIIGGISLLVVVFIIVIIVAAVNRPGRLELMSDSFSLSIKLVNSPILWA